MNRIIRDMSKKLNKEVRLNIIGEDTEVDKNNIEHKWIMELKLLQKEYQ
jgi:two-component system chemotaxis sensor kinase CheA